MSGGTFKSRIALGWGKSLMIERDAFYIHITQQISKSTYDYIKKMRPSYQMERDMLAISNEPLMRIVGAFDTTTKNATKRYYPGFRSGKIDEIKCVNRTNQLANSYKSIISNFNKEHKNETNNKKV